MEKKDGIALIVGATMVIITALACATFYNYTQTQAIKSNIESAIVKGIDPVAVKCAYAHSDNVCVAYAISHGFSNSNSKK